MSVRQLRHERDFTTSILNTAGALIVVLDQHGRFVRCNQLCESYCDGRCEEFVGQYLADLPFFPSIPVDREKAVASPQGGLISGRHEIAITTRDGRIHIIAWTCTAVKDDHDNFQSIIYTGTDVTEREEARKELAAEEEQLRVTLHSIADGVITTDTSERIVLINRVAESLTGWCQQEAEGKHIRDVYHLLDRQSHQPVNDLLQTVLHTGQWTKGIRTGVLTAKNGDERLVAESGAPILDQQKNARGAVLIFRDVTEQERLEAELLKARKLESLGVLAGGIAHDFNNILTGIVGNLSLVKTNLSAGDETHKLITNAEKAALRMTQLTHQLLTFAQGGVPIKKTSSVFELIRESVDFALTGSKARPRYDLPQDIWPCTIDEGQINQVIHNLVLNADQAMPQGGLIAITAENIDVGLASYLPISPGRYVKVAFEDQGVGIPEKYLSKVFDPYFSTKERGSGLGLATAYAIINRHDGHIEVQSEVGVGTKFTIYLPASDQAVVELAEQETEIWRGAGRILLMDDEAMVRDVASRLLKELGYTPILARDGAEAVKLYQDTMHNGEAVSAVILDLTVPGGKGGQETMTELIAIDPDVKGIVSSGYSDAPVMANYEEFGFSGVVTKPYGIIGLGKELHRLLHTSPA